MNRFKDGQLVLLCLEETLVFCRILEIAGNDTYRVNLSTDYLIPTINKFVSFQTIDGDTIEEFAINIEDLYS